MICFFARWSLSSELDTGKPMPAFIRRHFQTCRACAEYAVAVKMVETMLRENSGQIFASRVCSSSIGSALSFRLVCASTVAAALIMGAVYLAFKTFQADVRDESPKALILAVNSHEPPSAWFAPTIHEALSNLQPVLDGEPLKKEMNAVIQTTYSLANNIIAIVDTLILHRTSLPQI